MIKLAAIPENEHQVLYLLQGHLVGQANRYGDRVAYSLTAIVSEREEYQLRQETAQRLGVPIESLDRVGMTNEQNKARRKKWESLQRNRNGKPWRPNVLTRKQLAAKRMKRQQRQRQ